MASARANVEDIATRLPTAAIVVVGAAASLWLNLPGHLSYDSVVQLAEGRAGVYTGEHPLVMSWLLGVADWASPGAALFVGFDTLLVFGALLALVLVALRVSWIAAPLAALFVLLPQLAVYPAIVWKDVLFAAASAAGFASLAWAAAMWAQVRLRCALLAAALALLTLAALSRQNGPVVLPFAAVAVGGIAAGSGGPWGRAPWRTLAASWSSPGRCSWPPPPLALATRLETPGRDPGQAWTALQAYDIAGAVAREPALKLDVLKARAPPLEILIRTKGVAAYSPIRVDPLEPMFDQMDPSDDAPIAAQWRDLILRQPLLYLRVRSARRSAGCC